MLALTNIKKDIEFNKNFRSLLEVLKSIAISQFYLLEKSLKTFEKFDDYMQFFFESLDLNAVQHRFLREDSGPLGVVAITSDQGLLGGLNMRVVSTAVGLMKSNQDELVVVGDRGQTYARDFQSNFTAFPGIRDDQKEAQATALRDHLFAKAAQGRWGSVQVVYPKALSLINQRVEIATLLPFTRKTREAPATEKHPQDLIFESSVESILEYLIFLSMNQKLNEIFAYSRLAELGARYMHLEESTQKIQELNQKLKLRYFRLRHESIDQSLRELFSARVLYVE